MGLFKKKNSQNNTKDRELISQNEKAIDALLILAEKDENLVEKLKELKEKIKYLVPSPDDKIYDFDVKIKRHIEDMRIALVKSDGETSKKVENALADIRLNIADRNAKL